MIAKIKQLIIKILPSFFLNTLYNLQRENKRKRIKKMKDCGQKLNTFDIIKALKDVGVKEGDNLLVHCKMSSIGYVEGGADSVIDGLCIAINAPTVGTLLMPSFPHHQMAFEYFEKNTIFDVQNTPSLMGVVSEIFRTKPGVKRSLHPSHPVTAYGPKTDYFLDGHFKQETPFNKDSPFYKLCEVKGKILLIGLKMSESLTSLHVIEDVIDNFRFPVYLERKYNINVIDYENNSNDVSIRIHNPVLSKMRKCDDMLSYFDSAIIKSFKIGNADCLLIDANLMLEKQIALYEKQITIYSTKS